MLNNPIVRTTGRIVGSLLLSELIVYGTLVTVGLAGATVEKLTKDKKNNRKEERA